MDPAIGKRPRDSEENDEGSVRCKKIYSDESHQERDPDDSHIPQLGPETADSSIERAIHSTSKPLLNFLIIGAQKAGTVAAVKNLNKHPDIFVCPETHFFDVHWDKGLDWYINKLHTSKLIVGEKTPEIIYVDACAGRIKEVCPSAKFILFLREPVKRAFSGWNMQRLKGVEDLSFSEAVSRELDTMMGETRVTGSAEYHYIQRGFYMDQIERFMKVFPDIGKLLIVIAERIRSNADEEYRRIFDFLGARS
jgi:hypothetical protein